MVLESTILCVDNSEYSRNGDFAPSRFACQVDSVNMLCTAKVQANVESSVGLLTLAGRSARILITSTRDLGRIFTCMHDVQFDGSADVVAGIKKAQLALKHRQNSLQRQRIIVFVSSPIAAPAETLVRLGKILKKNSVAVDVINVGLEPGNTEKIDAFVEAVNSNDNSHALHVEPGAGLTLADAVMNSEIHHLGDGGSAVGAGAGIGTGAGVATGAGGLDESVDPELEMALRISMQEERARQAARAEEERQQNASAEGATADSSGQNNNAGGDSAKADDAPAASASAAAGKYDDDDGDLYGTGENMDVEYADEEAELRRAIELSNQEAQHAAEAQAAKEKNDDSDDKKES